MQLKRRTAIARANAGDPEFDVTPVDALSKLGRLVSRVIFVAMVIALAHTLGFNVGALLALGGVGGIVASHGAAIARPKQTPHLEPATGQSPPERRAARVFPSGLFQAQVHQAHRQSHRQGHPSAPDAGAEQGHGACRPTIFFTGTSPPGTGSALFVFPQ